MDVIEKAINNIFRRQNLWSIFQNFYLIFQLGKTIVFQNSLKIIFLICTVIYKILHTENQSPIEKVNLTIDFTFHLMRIKLKVVKIQSIELQEVGALLYFITFRNISLNLLKLLLDQ